MARLVDADELLKKAHNYYPSIDHYCCSIKAVDAQDIIDAPTIDAKPVVHGKWEYDEEAAKWGFPFICKAEGCGKAHNHKEKFCPNCGARMDWEV